MPTTTGPIGRPHGARAPTPSIKHCLKATVLAADRLDGWIRRYVVEHPLRYRPDRILYRSSAAGGRARAISCVLARIGTACCPPTADEAPTSKSGRPYWQ